MQTITFKHQSSGFTLIELLVVIAIIGILSSVVLASLNTAREKARDAQRLSDMDQIRLALEFFFDDNNHYPGPTFEGIDPFGEQLGDDYGPIEQALSPYLSVIPKDPLHDGTTYYYSYDPQHMTDSVPGSCDGLGKVGSVLAFNKAEKATDLRKDTCSGTDQNQDNADYNITFFPYPL